MDDGGSDARESSDQSARSSDSSSPFRGLEQLVALISSVDPVSLGVQAIDGTRRAVELAISTMENFASTVDNLNRTTSRINALLDDIEEPLKRVMPQVGGAMNAVATLGETAANLGELAKRLSPLASLAENAGGLFGLRPSRSSGDQQPGSPSTTPPGTSA